MREHSLSFLVNVVGVPEYRAKRYRRGVEQLTPEEARRLREYIAAAEAKLAEVIPARKFREPRKQIARSYVVEPQPRKKRACEICGTEFTVKGGGRVKFCSDQCAKVKQNQKYSGRMPGSFSAIVGK